jgi:hypothetical protein
MPFACIMGTMCAGILSLSWWAALAGACLLSLVSLSSPVGAFAYHHRTGAAVSTPVLLMSSLFNGLAAAVASFFLGRMIGWFWGI